jgi:ribosomal protein S18 acetylase RimI-like enzyme
VSLSIRTLISSDVRAAAQLVGELEFFQEWGLSAEAAGAALRGGLRRDSSQIWAAERNSELQGFAWVIQRGAFDRSSYLRLIAVRQARAGVGRALMEAIEAVVLEHTDLMLLVTESNLPARRFYEALGYLQVGVLPDYVRLGRSECIYRKARLS